MQVIRQMLFYAFASIGDKEGTIQRMLVKKITIVRHHSLYCRQSCAICECFVMLGITGGPPANTESSSLLDDTRKGASDLVHPIALIFVGAGSEFLASADGRAHSCELNAVAPRLCGDDCCRVGGQVGGWSRRWSTRCCAYFWPRK